jgi:uncharacterized protein YaiI (UPF0178 family)
MDTLLLKNFKHCTLCIARMHRTVEHSQGQQKGEVHIIKRNCESPMEMVVTRSVDYAATILEKGIPSHILQSYINLHK